MASDFNCLARVIGGDVQIRRCASSPLPLLPLTHLVPYPDEMLHQSVQNPELVGSSASAARSDGT